MSDRALGDRERLPRVRCEGEFEGENWTSVPRTRLAIGTSTLNHVRGIRGRRRLVVGATGGVGSYTIQLAAARGAKVVASALPQDEAWIRGLGANEIVDYSGDVVAAMLERYPEGVDGLIVAAHVGDGFGALTDLVKDGGGIASTVGGADVEALAQRGVVADERDRPHRPRGLRASRPDGGGRHAQRPDYELVQLRRAPAGAPARGEERSRGKFAIKISP
jgi:NADPH:quinone reductase